MSMGQTKENRESAQETALPMKVKGCVVHGRGKGRTVGMPTVNLAVNEGMKLPPVGVYATRVYLDGQVWMGVTNVGTRPSVDHETDITVETFILDFHGNIYGRGIEVEFYQFLRPVRKMESLEAVRLQVEKDSLRVRKYFSQDFAG